MSLTQTDSSLKNVSILLVEDEDLIRELLKDELEELSASVTEAQSAEQALEIVRVKNFDLIITDLRMPGQGGLNLIVNLSQNNSYANTKVIVITGNLDYGKNELQSYGVLGIFFKPVNFKEFTDFICQHFSRK